MPNDKPETPSQITPLEIDFSAIEKRIMAHMLEDAMTGEPDWAKRKSHGQSLTGRLTNAKPFDTRGSMEGSVTAKQLQDFYAGMAIPYIRKIRIAPGTLDLFAKAIEQTGGITFTQKDQVEGTMNFSAFDGLEVVEDPMFCNLIGAMDMSDGTVRLFDWTPKEVRE